MTARLFLVCGVVLIGMSSALAQERKSPVESSLIDVEKRWVAALVKSDIPTLDQILTDSYVDTDEDGHQTDKRGVLAALKSGDLKMTSIDLSGMRVYSYGNFAVVTGSANQLGAYQGQPLQKKIVFTDSFILQNGKWRAVASHRSAVHGG